MITVYGKPSPKGSFKAIARPSGAVYLKPANDGERGWRESIAWAARAAHLQLIKRPQAVRLEIDFYFERPRSHANKGTKAPPRPSISPPDIDKLQRSVLDALSGIAYDDDRQVVEIVAAKHYGERPHARITIKELLL